MNDLIRRAVELADGWSINHDDLLLEHESIWQLYKVEDAPQTILDALAAQLVRQVDFENIEWVCVEDTQTVIFSGDEYAGESLTVKGKDRTMNTIQACVEFLEGQKDE